MLLSLLLASLADAVGADARRAATHEVARRMGIGWRRDNSRPEPVEVPVAIRSIDRMVQAIRRAAASHPNLDTVETSLLLHLEDLLSEWLGVRQSRDPFSRFGPVFLPLLDLERVRAIRKETRRTHPGDDAAVDRAEAEALASNTGWSTTPNDILLARFAEAMEQDLAKDPRSPPSLVRLDVPQARSIRDWVRETEAPYTDQTLLRLRALTWDQIVAAAADWHTRMRGGLGYGKPVADAFVVLRWPDGVTLQRLFTKRDFAAEGASMGHCVGGDQDETHLPRGDSGYYRSTRDGHGATFSLRSPSGVPAATFEVVYQSGFFPDTLPKSRFALVTQIQGPDDDEINSFDGKGLDGAPFGISPIPYLLDTLVRLRLLRDTVSDDRGDFGHLSIDAVDRLPGITLQDPPIATPMWFPGLSPADRTRMLEAKAGRWSIGTDEPMESFFARAALAPKADLVALVGANALTPSAVSR